MIVTTEQAQEIIKNNPNKQLISDARDYSKKLQINILGRNCTEAIASYDYFENPDIQKIRSKNATSNVDLFGRLLHREEIVFTAKGGSNNYSGLSDSQTQAFDATLDNIRFGMSIRRWVKEFALKAYRTDPMAVLFIEVGADLNPYPTYKSIDCIYDYQTTGRKVEYVCFRLKGSEVKQLLPDLQDTEVKGMISQYTNYFRMVDDENDIIYKNSNGTISEVDKQAILFNAVPAIVASDLIDFTNTQNFLSPLQATLELATNYFNDRSVRDIQKLYNGFAKSYEPLVACGICDGTGLLSGKACPGCTPAGSTRGTGYKLSTKVADSIKVPLPKAGDPNGTAIDMSKYFGYASPPIDIWNKQDTSLNDIETAMNNTYWGTNTVQSTTGPTVGDKHAFKETATKTLADMQPIYERLNLTANWAETTENQLCNFIGFYQFGEAFKKSGRTYGRYYILETPDELIEQYLDMKQKGAPQVTLTDALEKYYHSVFANNPNQLAIKLKLMDVEPFLHLSVDQVLASDPSDIDFFMKLYFSEWYALQTDAYLLTTQASKLIDSLKEYATTKMAMPAYSITRPTVSVGENIRNTN